MSRKEIPPNCAGHGWQRSHPAQHPRRCSDRRPNVRCSVRATGRDFAETCLGRGAVAGRIAHDEVRPEAGVGTGRSRASGGPSG